MGQALSSRGTQEFDQSDLVTTVHALEVLVEQATKRPTNHQLCRALRVLRDLCQFENAGKRDHIADTQAAILLPGFIAVSRHGCVMNLKCSVSVRNIILKTLVFEMFKSVPSIDQAMLDKVNSLMPPPPVVYETAPVA